MKSTLIKILASAFILFHISSVFVLPNPEGILYRHWSWVTNYGNLFGFNTTWRFFSPNPLIRVLEYDVFYRDQTGDLQMSSFQYPKPLSQEPSREVYNRKMTNGMFMLSRGDHFDKTLGVKLCSWHPRAETIAIYTKGRVFPSVEKSRFEGSRVSDIGAIERIHVKDLECSGET